MYDSDWKKCLICDDSRNVIRRIPDNSIDLILTDPPYNLGQHSTGNIFLPGRAPMNNDVADWDKLDFNPEEWADEFIRILKPTGNLFIFTSYNQLGRWYQCLDHRFDTSNFLIWHKTNPAPKIFKAGFLNSCEMIFTCWNKKHTWNFISQSEMHNFIESPICMYPERIKNPKHPTQKPLSVLRKLISIASNEGDIVFDPFMGVGSTGVAALELGRRFIGVEIDSAYSIAASKRIEQFMENDYPSLLNEPMAAYGTAVKRDDEMSGLFDIYNPNNEIVKPKVVKFTSYDTSLQPIIKWPGGKEKELTHIIPELPSFIRRYYEPFVGGGAVFTAVSADEYYINDKSSELINLYIQIAQCNELFFSYCKEITEIWDRAEQLTTGNDDLYNIYIKYRIGEYDDYVLRKYIKLFCVNNKTTISNMFCPHIDNKDHILEKEMENNLLRKMKRMRVLEQEKHILPSKDIYDNIETAVKSAVYMYFRYIYNKSETFDNAFAAALFFFIRNYCYSGMFRYNGDGGFNVPYGGIAYNSKDLRKKLSYYKGSQLKSLLQKTQIECEDFETFLDGKDLTSEDFVFLDPPYDTDFSTYAQNEFSQDDQRRLASYLIEKCKAKWMLVIKNTPFIYDLYCKEGIKIKSFDKRYSVSFMNRNNKDVTHLLVTNY